MKISPVRQRLRSRIGLVALVLLVIVLFGLIAIRPDNKGAQTLRPLQLQGVDSSPLQASTVPAISLTNTSQAASQENNQVKVVLSVNKPSNVSTSAASAVVLPRAFALDKAETEAALSKSVVVAVKTTHFFGSYARVVPDCKYQGRTIGCEFVDAMFGSTPTADALWFHAPSNCGGTIHRDQPSQLTVVMSMEAATYYPCLDDQRYMDQFDIEMTYRKCSHVQSGYFADSQTLTEGTFFRLPKPWDQLESAVAYVNSNCGALNNRNGIVRELMSLNRLPVDAWGQCLRNKVLQAPQFKKVAVFRKYKFCISMENSNTLDYVTEKIWQALESGCLPIYMGAPNIQDFIPSPDSIIDYNQYKTPEKLMDYLELLSGDEELYMKHHAWRTAPVNQLSAGFRKMVIGAFNSPHSQCALCQVIMEHRIYKRPLSRTHCLRNQTWMKAKATGGTTWTPASDVMLNMPWPLPDRPIKPSL